MRASLPALVALLAGCAGSGEAEPVATQTVVVPGPWVFEPRVAEVQAGVPVTFRNEGAADHTVTFADVAFDATLEPGESATWTFDGPGLYEYVCTLHPPDMRGSILVQPTE